MYLEALMLWLLADYQSMFLGGAYLFRVVFRVVCLVGVLPFIELFRAQSRYADGNSSSNNAYEWLMLPGCTLTDSSPPHRKQNGSQVTQHRVSQPHRLRTIYAISM